MCNRNLFSEVGSENMATITDIKRCIQELGPAPFQEFCDTLISKHGYGIVHGYGMKAGSGKTTIGNPDTYFKKENGKYVFVAYTTQQNSIYSKLKEDIDKCLDSTKTGLDVSEIEEIICCHTSSNLSAGDDKKLHDYCENYGVPLSIWGIDEMANQVHNRFRSMAKDFLGLSLDTNQILSVEDFIRQSDANEMSAPLNTTFQYREKEKEDIIKSLETNSVTIITGKAGVGKTRLVLESIQDFAMTKNYKLLCVKNNNLELYADLVTSTENPGNYLFFVDDANELAELNLILEYTTKKQSGFNVRIIVTVRDYVKSKVISSVKEYTLPTIIEILPFSDDEIKGFLADNLEISNENYVKQIIQIAEGNPRIAYMAGKLAVEEQNLSAIKDVSQLYDAYYRKYVDSTLGEDRVLCFTAGVLSVVNFVTLNNMSHLNELLENYGISADEFKAKIRELSRLEVVEIQLDQVATLTDQCLANYMLYYVFFEKKIIQLSDVIEIGYKFFRNGVIRSINTILNLFESEETKDYCERQILDAWDNLKKEKHPSYENFVRDFHVFRPEEAFIMAQKKIDNIDNEEFNILDIDFSKNVFCQHESILSFLTGYQCSEYLDYVMEILLVYSSKSSETIVLGSKWLENNYGIGISDYRYRYYTQRKISKYLLDAVSKNNKVAMAIGFQWSKYSLAFSFHSTEKGRENTVTFYNLELKQSEGLDVYRKLCWEILILLATRSEWKDKVILFLDEYSRNLYKEPNKDIFANEVEYIEQLISTLKCNKISYFIVVRRILTNAEKTGIRYDKKWDKIFTGEEWTLYKLLEKNYIFPELEYEDYKRNKEHKIIEYGRKLSESDVRTLILNINNILSDKLVKRDSYEINRGLELIIQQFDELRLKEFLNQFIQLGDNISINPSVVLKPLNENSDSVALLELIKQAKFPQKNEWLFSFFETLPEPKVTSYILEEFLDFLKSDSDKEIASSSYRNLRLLDKFIKIEPDIYSIATSLIYEKREYSSFIVNIYFELLFDDQIYSPKELLKLYKGNINLLQDIYFFMIKQGSHIDYHGTFLIEFLLLDQTWLHKYAMSFWEDIQNNTNLDSYKYKNNALWQSEYFIKYFDYIFYSFPKEEFDTWRIGSALKEILMYNNNYSITKQHKQEWLTHIITQNASNDWIYVIFDFVCELDDDIKRNATKTLLENNSDFETFNKLFLLPNHWIGWGSFIPAYQEQIDYLESLYPLVSGMKFIKHRAMIKSKIEKLRKMIKREEIEEIQRNLSM